MRNFNRQRLKSNSRAYPRLRWALNFDGVGVRGVLANRAINPDGDIDIEWTQYGMPATGAIVKCIVTQCSDANFGLREFGLRWSSGKLDMFLGGQSLLINADNVGVADGNWRVTYIGTTVVVYYNGQQVYTRTATRGASRELSALTNIGFRNAAGTPTEHFGGVLRDIKINGTLWPINEFNQTIQLPEPNRLGADSIGSNIFTTTTGYDSITLGTANSATVTGNISQSRTSKSILTPYSNYLLEVTLSNTTAPITVFVRDGASAGAGTIVTSLVLSVGVNRLLFTPLSANSNLLFTTNLPANFTVNNISVKQMDNCNYLTLFGTNQNNWTNQLSSNLKSNFRHALNFDGIGVRVNLFTKAVDVDKDIDIEFYTPSVVTFPGTSRGIVMQCTSTTPASREFELFFSGGTGNLGATVGGSIFAIGLAGTFKPNQKLRWTMVGNTSTLYDENGVVIRQMQGNRGAAREPAAFTVVGARWNGSNYLDYFLGTMQGVKINGTTWDLIDHKQTFQLPTPNDLGIELITQSVLENPSTKGTQWVYLGNGSWSYQGDGSLQPLEFIALGSQPASGVVEFEVESITGTMVCSAGSIGVSAFNSVGFFRYVYSVDNVNNKIQFKRPAPGSIVSCVIKNISFKPLGDCNFATVTGSVSNWTVVPDLSIPKQKRKYLNFDGIGTRATFTQRLINPDGNIDIEWYQNGFVLDGTVRTIVSQSISSSFALNEFRLCNVASNRLNLLLGGNSVDVLNFEQGWSGTGRFRVTLIGSVFSVYKNGVLVNTGTFNRGAAREPSAPTMIGVQLNGAGVFYRYWVGKISDVVINGVQHYINEPNQNIQLPTPKNLGAEIVTQAVLENPATKGSQWTYLGGGRWQYVGDGTLNELRFVLAAFQPTAGYVEFEIEQITGIISCTNNVLARSNFADTGKKRFFYTDINESGASGASITFKRVSGVASCIIKNISFKPLSTSNPLTINGANSLNWLEE